MSPGLLHPSHPSSPTCRALQGFTSRRGKGTALQTDFASLRLCLKSPPAPPRSVSPPHTPPLGSRVRLEPGPDAAGKELGRRRALKVKVVVPSQETLRHLAASPGPRAAVPNKLFWPACKIPGNGLFQQSVAKLGKHRMFRSRNAVKGHKQAKTWGRDQKGGNLAGGSSKGGEVLKQAIHK